MNRNRPNRQWNWIILGGLFAIGLLMSNVSMLEDVFDLPPRPTSPAVEQLALATTMTRSAQRLFYHQNPTIEPQATFVSSCKVPDKGIMLGCYSRRGKIGKIVIQSVTDPRLRGVMEVTAAHEMLHAAYEKLSQPERDRLTPRLIKAIEFVQDQRLLNVLRDYKKRDFALYANELHSHLGTELRNLADPVLEQHYRQYFSDRPHVAAFAEQSGAPLKQLDQKADGLKPEIDQLEVDLKQEKQALDDSEAGLKASASNLTALESQLNQTKASAENALARGESNIDRVAQFEQEKAEFNRQVGLHNDRVQLEKDQVAQFNQKVDLYKQKVTAYNQVGKDERQLLDSLKGGATTTSPLTESLIQSLKKPVKNRN
jgi:hypothetical protein